MKKNLFAAASAVALLTAAVVVPVQADAKVGQQGKENRAKDKEDIVKPNLVREGQVTDDSVNTSTGDSTTVETDVQITTKGPKDNKGKGKKFKDVDDKNGHFKDIAALSERGIINGYSDGSFQPNRFVTRGEAAVILARVLKLDTTNVKDPGFIDVAKDSPQYGAIAALVEAGVFSGTGKKKFNPNVALNRGQMAKILVAAFELKGNGDKTPFVDVNDSAFKEFINALYELGIASGTTATTFNPNGKVTRAQLASFLVRCETKQEQLENEETDETSTTEDSATVTTGDTTTPTTETPATTEQTTP